MIKTTLAPNAPWIPTEEQWKSPTPKVKRKYTYTIPKREQRQKKSLVDLNFEKWLATVDKVKKK